MRQTFAGCCAKEVSGVARNTLSAYRRDLARYLDYLAEREVDSIAEVDSVTVSGFLAFLREGDAVLPQALAGVHQIDRVLELDRHQPETTLTFEQYINLVVSQQRVQEG